MYTAEIASLATAVCWSFGSVLGANPARALGAIPFNRIRMSLVFLMLASMALVTGGWLSLNLEHSAWLILSAFIGIFVGDTALYSSVIRLGPRRTGILFATNAPMTALLGFLVLGESLPWRTVAGIALITGGVFLAVFHGRRAGQTHEWEEVHGSLGWGVAIGLAAALCQAVATIIARPVLAAGVDAVAASALRVGVGALALIATTRLNAGCFHGKCAVTPRLVGQIALSGLVGMALGMTFLLFALASGPAGVVSTLSATSPVLILPVIWVITRERPAAGAWVGAALAVIGAGCIFNS